MYHIYILKMSNIIPVLALLIVTLIQDILYYTDYDIDSKYYNTDDNLKRWPQKRVRAYPWKQRRGLFLL